MYVAARKMVVMGVTYEPMQEVPVAGVPARTLPALLKLRRLLEVPDAKSGAAAPVAGVRKRGRPVGSRNTTKTAALVAAEG